MSYKRHPDDINNLPHLAEFRKELRSSMTHAEASLWNMLKNSQFEGRKFRRQHSVGNYILDFYCPAERLAIELDGSKHFSGKGQAYDRERTKYLESQDIRVLRFENERIFHDRDWVADMIRDNFRFGPKPPTRVYGRGKHYNKTNS
ncbi:MAG: endonuclease domain-containing protein [Chloracidobacterium sp.]|nr:endonuclease domain-containing protein [Chloracidobacterium sp.]MCC6824237.1 endonuclease domain-containing protein [Acidobacteriota bacterium]MCO5334351.1 DUF559 domain-containing protein [Pyrinomonadaceae bacterium]